MFSQTLVDVVDVVASRIPPVMRAHMDTVISALVDFDCAYDVSP